MMVVIGLLVTVLTFVEERLSPTGELRIYQDDTSVGHEDGRDVAAAEGRRVAWSRAGQDIQVVLQLLDVDDFRPGGWARGLLAITCHRERPPRSPRRALRIASGGLVSCDPSPV